MWQCFIAVTTGSTMSKIGVGLTAPNSESFQLLPHIVTQRRSSPVYRYGNFSTTKTRSVRMHFEIELIIASIVIVNIIFTIISS